MANNNNVVSVANTDTELRTHVEEYITQQKSEFTLKGVCSYILYWAVEDGKVADGKGLIGMMYYSKATKTEQSEFWKLLLLMDVL